MSHGNAIKSRSIFTTGRLAATFIVLTMAAMGGQVQAHEAPDYDTTVVRYPDLNLESQAGARALYARLRTGAEGVCSSFENRDFGIKKLWQACFDHAVAAAVVQINAPELTSLHNQRVNHLRGGR